MHELGFTRNFRVRGCSSIAEYFPKSENRCGIYLLHFFDGLAYIGQAIDVVRRFTQHRKENDDIEVLRFLPAKRAELDTLERDLIHKAEESGILLTNKVHVSQIRDETELDSLVAPCEQEAWLQDEHLFAEDTERVTVELEEQYRVRQKRKFQRFRRNTHFESVVTALKEYTAACILAPKRTEFSFWSVSCMPSTKNRAGPRLAAVNLNRMEVLVIGYCKDEPARLWSFVNIAQAHFLSNYSQELFRREHPDAWADYVGYVAAGSDQVTIHADGTDALLQLLQDPAVLEAASILNLRLMKNGRNIYSNSHCFELADLLI